MADIKRLLAAPFNKVFVGKVIAVIDERLGLASHRRPRLIPVTDGPSFVLSPRHGVKNRSIGHVKNVLPQRKQADYLINLY
jgi:hypothetical protein